METTLTVGAISRLAGVTVRTLHHYDQIGLVSPSERTEAGYRLYGRRQVERLQEVLFFKELGFGLEEIRQIVEAPGYRRDQALVRQRQLLEARASRLMDMIEAVDDAIEAERTGMSLSPEEMLEVFGDFDPAEHEQEAEERWGGTDAYKESVSRTDSYTKQDWLQHQEEAVAINEGLLALMAGKVPAESAAAMDLAERHRAHISKWFYDCTPEIHAGLGLTYVADERFAKNIDKAGEGLAAFLSAAIAANADRTS
ncbi:MAG TPA: MerR family transcriptional regulator [Acidimicrobiia bacterium]|jgi:DNA-binding transcriptional MerR regulator